MLDNNPDRIGIWKCWFLRRGENGSTRRKTSQSKEENQQQTQLTYDAGSGNRTRDTLVGGERSHHCAIPAPFLRIVASLIDCSIVVSLCETKCSIFERLTTNVISNVLYKEHLYNATKQLRETILYLIALSSFIFLFRWHWWSGGIVSRRQYSHSARIWWSGGQDYR